MSMITINDYLSISLNQDVKELVDAYVGKYPLEVSDSFNASLLVKVDATHSGFVNGNKVFYIPDKMRESVGTWTAPFEKPVLTHHDKQGDPIGRVVNAVYFDSKNGLSTPIHDSFSLKYDGPALFTAKDAEKGNDPKGYTQLLHKITNKDAIEKISDGRFKTVSIGASTKEAWCSICKHDLVKDGICEHIRGKYYPIGGADDSKQEEVECFWLLGRMENNECSYVNVPADKFASVVGMERVANSNPEVASVDFLVDTGEKMLMLKDFVETENIIVVDMTPIDEEKDDMAKIQDSTTSEQEEKVEAQEEDTKQDETSPDVKTEDKNDPDKGDEVVDFGEVPEEDLEELKKLDAMLEDDDAIAADAKLSTAQRKKLSGSTFCGPNRSFPVPDCAHVTAARRLIGRAKVSSDTKSKILACVSRKAKSLGCGSSKDSEMEKIAFEAALDAVTKQAELYKSNWETAEKLYSEAKDQIAHLEAELQTALDENTKLLAGSHEERAKEVLELRLKLKKPDMKDILDADDEQVPDLKETKLKELIARTPQSIKDSLDDLRLEVDAQGEPEKTLEPVTNPGVVDEKEDDDEPAKNNGSIKSLPEFRDHKSEVAYWLKLSEEA